MNHVLIIDNDLLTCKELNHHRLKAGGFGGRLEAA